MPLDVWFDADRNLRHAVARGKLTDRDLLETWGDVLADPGYDPTADNLVDMSGVDRFEVTALGAQRLADVFAMRARPAPPGVRPRVAFVAPTDDAFTLLRMYEMYRELQGSPSRYFVCRTMEEARCWLGLPKIDRPELPRAAHVPTVRVIDLSAARAAR
jgi:hypothetical protein